MAKNGYTHQDILKGIKLVRSLFVRLSACYSALSQQNMSSLHDIFRTRIWPCRHDMGGLVNARAFFTHNIIFTVCDILLIVYVLTLKYGPWTENVYIHPLFPSLFLQWGFHGNQMEMWKGSDKREKQAFWRAFKLLPLYIIDLLSFPIFWHGLCMMPLKVLQETSCPSGATRNGKVTFQMMFSF